MIDEKEKNVKEIYALITNTYPDAVKVTVTVTHEEGIMILPEYNEESRYLIKDISGKWHGRKSENVKPD